MRQLVVSFDQRPKRIGYWRDSAGHYHIYGDNAGFKESEHPRGKEGTSKGGQFVKKGGQGGKSISSSSAYEPTDSEIEQHRYAMRKEMLESLERSGISGEKYKNWLPDVKEARSSLINLEKRRREQFKKGKAQGKLESEKAIARESRAALPKLSAVLSDNDKDLLSDYLQSGLFGDFREYMIKRGKRSHVKNPDYEREISELNRILDKSRLKKPATVYRGVRGDFAKSLIGKKQGDLIKFGNFSFTSLSAGTARRYAAAGYGQNAGIVFVINLPEGTPALSTGDLRQEDPELAETREVLLSDRTQYRFDGYDPETHEVQLTALKKASDGITVDVIDF